MIASFTYCDRGDRMGDTSHVSRPVHARARMLTAESLRRPYCDDGDSVSNRAVPDRDGHGAGHEAPTSGLRCPLVARLLGLLLVPLVVAAGCGGDDSTTVYRQAGQAINVGRGKQFVIELESNPSTGYSWQLAASPGEQVTLVDHDYSPVGEQKPGSGGVQKFTFEGAAVGSATLSFGYSRPWEKDVAPTRTAEFPVTVT
jgi:predicted secreted protein